MSWSEYQPCRFKVMPSGDGKPSVISIEFTADKPSLLAHKLIASVYFSLRPGATWDEAEALCEAMDQGLGSLCVRHAAAGEL